ncbi:arginine-tRNA-protein transferase [Sporodiniella umbellata]|nr:arginine-tRNA-protein transferase [Sporodiniella umbellata]
MSDSEVEENFDTIKNGIPSLISLCGSGSRDCGYCKKNESSSSFGMVAHFLTCSNYQDLIDRGWRRSGTYLYKPNMAKTCCPQYTIRLHANNYKLSKGQKKILIKLNKYIQGEWSPDHKQHEEKKPPKNNSPKELSDFIHPTPTTESKHSLKIELEPSSFTKEKFELYKKYQMSIHGDNEEDITESGFSRFLVDSPLKEEESNGVQLGSFHQRYILDGQLIAVSVIDILPGCVSGVYFMYDPDYSFLGLGKYSALNEISLVQQLSVKVSSLKYYYMGFYIDTCPKMSYKAQYEPSDLLDPVDYKWHSIEKFRKELKDKAFVTFAENSTSATKNGWLNPKEVTSSVLSFVKIYVGDESVLPADIFLKLVGSSRIKKYLVDFVCAIGLSLAYDITVKI